MTDDDRALPAVAQILAQDSETAANVSTQAPPPQTRLSSGSSQVSKGDRDSGTKVGLAESRTFSSMLQRMGTLIAGAKHEEESELKAERGWDDVLKSLQTEKKRKVAREEQHYLNPALCCVRPDNPIREQMIKLAEWEYFNKFVLFLIAVNCIFLLLDDPVCNCQAEQCSEQQIYRQMMLNWSEEGCSYWKPVKAMLDTTEIIFTALFTFECVIKIIARGFILHKHAYLRDPFNWLDFIVVVSSVLSLIMQHIDPNGANLGWTSVLRTVRVLRPLRTMTRIKGMRPLIDTLIRAFIALSNVMFLLIFFLAVFAILGHELFGAKLHGRCFVKMTADQKARNPAAWSRLLSQQVPFLASSTVSIGAWNADEGTCGDDSHCDPVVIDFEEFETFCSQTRMCVKKEDDAKFSPGKCETEDKNAKDWNGNPYGQGGGLLSFDNCLQALLIVWQCLTVEGWVDQMYTFVSVETTPAFAIVYFSLIVILGTFFVLQLLLAVLSEAYTMAQEEILVEKQKEALDTQAILKPNPVRLKKKKERGWKMLLWSCFRCLQGSQSNGRVIPDGSEHTIDADSPSQPDLDLTQSAIIRRPGHRLKSQATWAAMNRQKASITGKDSVLEKWLTAVSSVWARIKSVVKPIIHAPIFQNIITAAILLNAAIMGMYHHNQLFYEEDICKHRCDLDPGLPANASQYCHGPLFNRTWTSDGFGRGTREPQRAFCFLAEDEKVFGKSLDTCWQHKTREDCENPENRGKNGLGCFYFDEGEFTEWNYAIEPGCKMGLYDSNSFAAQAPQLTEYNQTQKSIVSMKLGLRQVCGDNGLACLQMPSKLDMVLDTVNMVLTIIFVLEMLLKMIGLGLGDYFQDSFNCFDCAIVCFSIFEIILSQVTASTGSGLSALRGLRLLRLFKLARSWKDMRMILSALGKSLGALFYCGILLLIFMYILALLCMQLFGGIQNGNGLRFSKSDAPRSNFDSFWPSPYGHGALTVIFQIITGENWNVVMYDLMTNSPQDGGGFSGLQALNGLIPVLIVFLGNYIIMNVFIAILLGGFMDKEEDSKQDMDEIEDEDLHLSSRGYLSRLWFSMTKMLTPKESAKKKMVIQIGTRASHLETKKLVDVVMRKCCTHQPGTLGPVLVSKHLAEDDDIRVESNDQVWVSSNEIEVRVHGLHGKRVKMPEHTSLFIFPPFSPVRQWCAFIVRHKAFDNFILGAILFTTITLIFVESPKDSIIADNCPKPPDFLDCSQWRKSGEGNVNCLQYPGVDEEGMFGKVFEPCDSKSSDNVPECCQVVDKVHAMATIDKTFAIIFLIEFMLKVVADGFIFHKLAYLRDPWNILDLSIVVISLLTAFASDDAAKHFKVLRAFRALRPLRAVKRSPSLKVAAMCLIASVPKMMNVCVVVLVWFSMYSMLGVQLFRGKFYRCENVQDQLFYGNAFEGVRLSSIYVPTLALSGPNSVPTIFDCVSAGQSGETTNLVSGSVWQPKPYSFNNILSGVLILIETSTTEGWLDLMAMCADSTEKGVTPLPNTNPYIGTLYAVVHVFLGAFVLWNLIVAEVISQYMKIKAQNNGVNPFMTAEQEDWQKIQRLINSMKPRERVVGPTGVLRSRMFSLLNQPWFDQVITATICLNTIQMVADVHDQSRCTVAMFFYMNLCFTVIFVLEAAIKILGLGPRWYFVDAWNTFDFTVVVFSILTLILDGLAGNHDCVQQPPELDPILTQLSKMGILRAIRILRVFRLVRRVQGIRDLLGTLIRSLPSLGSVAGLLILMMAIFAVLGVNLFHNLNPGQDVYGNIGDAGGIDNYRTFSNAFSLLLRQTTGEAWNYMMWYSMQGDPYKACDIAYGDFLGQGCGGQMLGTIYHVAWQLLGTYVLMQLFTAIIIENFSEVVTGGASIVSKDQLNEFVDQWSDLDQDCLGCISYHSLPELIRRVPPPIGLRGKNITASMMMNVLKDLHIPIRNGKVSSKFLLSPLSLILPFFESLPACPHPFPSLDANDNN